MDCEPFTHVNLLINILYVLFIYMYVGVEGVTKVMVTSNIYIVLSLSLAFFLVLPTKANLTGIVSFTFNDFSKGKPNLILEGETVSSWSGEL